MHGLNVPSFTYDGEECSEADHDTVTSTLRQRRNLRHVELLCELGKLGPKVLGYDPWNDDGVV
jgi:hypothetical protein